MASLALLLSLLCSALGDDGRGVEVVHVAPSLVGARMRTEMSSLAPLRLQLRGGLSEDDLEHVDIGHLGLDALDDDDVLLTGRETDQPAGCGLIDLSGDGGLSPSPRSCLRLCLIPWHALHTSFGGGNNDVYANDNWQAEPRSYWVGCD